MGSGSRGWMALCGLVAVVFALGYAVGRVTDGASAAAQEPAVSPTKGPVRLPPASRAAVPEVFHRLRGASHSEFVAELERMLEGGVYGEADWLAFSLRWVLEDPQGGADHLLALIGDGESEASERYFDAFEYFFYSWAKQDADSMAIYAGILESRRHPLAEDLNELLLEGGDAKRALEFLTALDPDVTESQSSEIYYHLGQLAQEDPRRATDFLQLLRGNLRLNTVNAIGREWARSDPVAAFEWASGMLAAGERKNAVGAIIAEVAAKDPQLAMEWFARFPGDLINTNASKTLLAELGKDDLRGALQWYHGQIESIGKGRPVKLRLWQQDSIVDLLPRQSGALRETLAGLPAGTLKNELLATLLHKPRIDYSSDPATFLTEIGAMPSDELRANLMSGGLRGWGAHDPGATRAAVLALSGEMRATAINDILQTTGAFENAAQLVEFATAAGIDADQVVQNMGYHGPWRDHSNAADFFAQVTDLGAQSRVGNYVASWAQQSPAEALNWVNQRPGEHPGLIGQVVAGWLRSDPRAASEWALELQDPAARAISAAAVAKTMRYQDPEASFAWALEVPDGIERAELLRQAYLRWETLDQEAAQQALGRDGVPAELREVFSD